MSIGLAVASSQFDEADAKDARAWKTLGVAFASMQRYSEAEPAFAQACSLPPQLLGACYYNGRALYARIRFDASLAALRRALPFDRSWKLHLAIPIRLLRAEVEGGDSAGHRLNLVLLGGG
ncbi:MAG: hypothetical protein U0Q16_08915 [Bryobacteraceae bacterium]